MPRPKGLPKTGGRQNGTPNKKTIYLSDALLDNTLDVPKKIIELLPQLSAEKQADILIKIMPYLFKNIKNSPTVTEIVYTTPPPAFRPLKTSDEILAGLFNTDEKSIFD